MWRWPIVLTTAFVVQSSLLLTSTVQSVQNNVPPQAFPSGIKRLPDIYWNSSNPIFRIDNTDHIIDVNQGRNPQNPMEYDQVNILCPLYEKGSMSDEDTERYIIYHVNKEEYDMCRIMTAHPRIIAQCNEPFRLRYYTISFRSFSPSPGALEFHAGKDYYFISTSSKDDLHLRAGGKCRTHNMKLVFKVADGQEPKNQEPASPVLKPAFQDNQVPVDPPSDNSLEDIEDKKERRRRRKKERRLNKEMTSTEVPPRIQEFSYNSAEEKFRQKEPSHVEKVNNLMKQEASSIFAGGQPTVSRPCSVLLIIMVYYNLMFH